MGGSQRASFKKGSMFEIYENGYREKIFFHCSCFDEGDHEFFEKWSKILKFCISDLVERDRVFEKSQI